jgi:hypothetical protein
MGLQSKLTVEVDPGSDPITGRVTDERGTRSFSGWLELAAELQATLEDPDAEDVSSA